MASNPPSSGSQSLWLPPAPGSMNSPGFASPYAMQFCPAAPSPQLLPFIPASVTQQFHHVGQEQNLGGPPGQNQLPPFSQPTQQFLPRSSHLGLATPSSYAQTSMPITSGMPQPQATAPSNGVSFSASYIFAPYSFGLSQNIINVPAQFQPMGQPWLHSSQNTPFVAPLQQGSQQALAFGAPITAINGSSTSQQIGSDWQGYEASDGRRYYYNKITKQSSWEKPLELMTPLRCHGKSGEYNNLATALYPDIEGAFTFSRQANLLYTFHMNEKESVSGSRLVKNAENKACFGQKLCRKLNS